MSETSSPHSPDTSSSSSSDGGFGEGGSADSLKIAGKRIVKRHNTKTNLMDTNEIADKLKNLAIALEEPIICNGFRKFLVKNFCSENLTFWKEVEQFQQLTDVAEISERARAIYDTYISPKATNEVNLPFHVNEQLQQPFQSKEPITTNDVFDRAKDEIFALMQRDSFPRFLVDPIFQQCKQVFEKVRCLSVSSSSSEQLIEGDDGQLTDRDWSLILTGAKEKEFSADSVIVEQGTQNAFLYRLKTGKLSVVKNISGESVVLSVIDKPGTVFGELSVLGSMKATASIVAQEDTVVVRAEKEFILSFLVNEPRLAKRFFNSMAKKLANLLQEISSLSSEKKHEHELEETSVSSSVAKSDGLLCDRFGIPSSEVLVKQFECGLDRMVKRNGTAYIFQRYLCFEARFFGQRTRDIIRVKDITDIQKKPGKNTIIISTDSKKWKFVFKQLAESANFLQLVTGLQSVIRDRESDGEPDAPIVEESPDGNFLRPEEWNLLLGGEKRDKTMTVAKGDVIIREGQKYSLICQIVSGSCRIEKVVPGSDEENVVLGVLHSGELFGEITFLTEGVASASVVAEDDVELYFIDGSYLKDELFVSHPQLVVRFYHYLCRILSARIAQREQEGWGRSL